MRSFPAALLSGLLLTGGADLAGGAVPELLVEAPPAFAAAADRIRNIDRQRLEAAIVLTGLEEPGPPVRVLLAPEGSPPARAAPPWVSGYAYGALGRVVLLPERTPRYPDGSLEELLVHELSHVLVARAASGRPVPRWFNEGLAMLAGSSWNLEDRSRLTLALLRGSEVPLGELEALFGGHQGEVQRAYSVAGAMMRDLVVHHGRGAPGRVLDGIARGRPFPEAFREATGVHLDRAVASFWNRYSLWYRWVPILGSSFTLWLLIIALAMLAYGKKRRRAAALERAWEEEEGRLDLRPPDLH